MGRVESEQEIVNYSSASFKPCFGFMSHHHHPNHEIHDMYVGFAFVLDFPG